MHIPFLSALLPILNYTLNLPNSFSSQFQITTATTALSDHMPSLSTSDSERRESPLDVEHYPSAPPELDLRQVHIYIRHGERAPVGQRLTSPTAGLPEHWLMCHAGRAMRAIAVESASTTTPPGGGAAHIGAGVIADQKLVPDSDPGMDPYRALSYVRRAVERKDGTTVEGECMLGELTDLGRQSTFNYGFALRKLYIDRLKFLPSILRDGESAYFRSTNMPRTIESLQHVLHGLYPPSLNQTFLPRILIRNAKDENVLGNMFACRRLELMNLAFAKAAADIYNPLLAKLDPKVAKYVGGPLRIDGKPRASGVLDTLRAAQAHGLKTPSVFQEKEVIDLLEQSVVSEWFEGYKYPEFRRLAMGRLLDDLQRKMSHKAALGNKDPLKILIHSTHDTALAGLLATLDVFDHRWPPFTAAITFELFSSTYPLQSPNSTMITTTTTSNVPSIFSPFASLFTGFSANFISKVFSPTIAQPQSQHFVRMRYQNRTLALPICAEVGKHLEGHPEFCKLEAFKEAVKCLVPDDFDKECMPQNVTDLSVLNSVAVAIPPATTIAAPANGGS